jgi:hypothetical protein
MVRSTSRPREYLALLAGALIAGVCGALFDQVTATVSPEYFLEGKNLEASSLPFRLAVAWTGLRGGLPLGALVAGVGLVRSSRNAGFSWRVWLSGIATTLVASLAFSPVLVATLDPLGVRDASLGQWPRDVATRYLICWGLHAGAYLGVIVGVSRPGQP